MCIRDSAALALVALGLVALVGLLGLFTLGLLFTLLALGLLGRLVALGLLLLGGFGRCFGFLLVVFVRHRRPRCLHHAGVGELGPRLHADAHLGLSLIHVSEP